MKRSFRSVPIWGFGILLGAVLLWGFAVEPWLLTVRRVELVLPGKGTKGEFRVAVVSDTHLGGSPLARWRMRRIVRKVAAEKPDVVFLLGDYVAVDSSWRGDAPSPEELTGFFRSLAAAAPGGAYAVLGNHELLYGRARMTALLERAGIRVFENRHARIKINGVEIDLAGISDRTAPPAPLRAFRGVDFSVPLVVLIHAPRGLWRISPEAALTLAGHTHGGQIRIPGYGEITQLCKWEPHVDAGVSNVAGRRVFVTSGAGGHRLNFRFLCPPEIAMLKLVFK